MSPPSLSALWPALEPALGYLTSHSRELVRTALRLGVEAPPHALLRAASIARILADLHADANALCAAVLHCTVATSVEESASASASATERHAANVLRYPPFGRAAVRNIVEDVQSLEALSAVAAHHFDDLDDENARMLREYCVMATRDARAIIVKLAETLHKLRSRTQWMPLHEQHVLALQALQVYAPLAHAVGVGQMMWQLEDIGFRVLFPDSYVRVEQWHERVLTQRRGEQVLDKARAELMTLLARDPWLARRVDRYTIDGRTKHVFSTFKKMLRDNKRKDDVLDVVAMRVVADTRQSHENYKQRLRRRRRWRQQQQQRQPRRPEGAEKTEQLSAAQPTAIDNDEEHEQQLPLHEFDAAVCYRVYEHVVSAWTQIQGRFKDYCRAPKPNGYRSIHTTVMHSLGLPLEVQIRTRRVHLEAEYGFAAHQYYKGQLRDSAAVTAFAEGICAEHARLFATPSRNE